MGFKLSKTGSGQSVLSMCNFDPFVPSQLGISRVSFRSLYAALYTHAACHVEKRQVLHL